ncbi:MAG: hypothetical protein H7833_17705 [Magnetococcus sp. DMHC-1]
MQQTYTAVIKQVDGFWIGWIEEISGVNCQEMTRESLLESLVVTLKEAIEFNRIARTREPSFRDQLASHAGDAWP